ncbi:lipase 1 precursor protein [Rutstroemia sp. NJR-2017a BVV2]|nr:lipase 1 precursor protein [Rutstroemia sp. NJR-2017a BVV2]
MNLLTYSLLSLSTLFTSTLALPTASQSTPLPPSQDPFYTAPENYSSSAPGTVLRFRVAPGNLTSIFTNCSIAYNIVYRTTNSLYQPSWAVTTLLVPSTSNSSALLSYQIPYNTASVDASPSYTFYTDDLSYPDIPAALSLGWLVNVPDFEGPLASFAAGVEEGHAVLDSIRAVLSLSHRIGFSPSVPYAMWGYSGGSIASEFAAELQVQYAPEMNFSGMAIGGLPVKALDVLTAASSGIWAGLVPSALLGITAQYPDARNYLLSRLKPTGLFNATGFLLAQNFSNADALTYYQNQTIWDYFLNGSADILDAPVMQKIIYRDCMMGYHGVPQMPMLVYQAVADELAPIANTDALVDRYCGVGTNVLYQRNTIGGHLAEYVNGDEGAFEWLGAVLDGSYAGKYRVEGCTVQNVAINVTSSPE